MFFKSKKNEVFFIAEIGSNHEGNYKVAKKLTYQAIKAGADAVKFQIFNCDTLVNKKLQPERHKHFKRLQLDINEFIELAKICKKNKVIFMASVWCLDLLKKIDPYLSIHKVGSGDLTNYQILKELIKTKKPIILSTGLSSSNTVTKVINFIKKIDSDYVKKKKLAILQCSSNYPNPLNDVNLNTLREFEKKYNLPIGFSDHTKDSLSCEVSYILGAKIIEKHFTYNKNIKTFRDHQISMTFNEVKKFLKKLKSIKSVLGNKNKEILKTEKISKNIVTFRRGIYAKKNIKKGEKFSEENLIILRPLKGISADKYFDILGKKSLYDFQKNDSIKI